jgi:hypothetical protein
MRISKRVPMTVIVTALAALSTALAVEAIGAFGHDRGEHGKNRGGQLIRESLAPSVPTDPVFHGVSPGAAPWVLDESRVRLSRDGELDLRVTGLVIPVAPGNGTPGPVNTVSASLYCGADSDTTAADTTDQVPISRDGDARIDDDSFSVPATCLAPVILVHPNGNATAYIAVDGWRI